MLRFENAIFIFSLESDHGDYDAIYSNQNVPVESQVIQNPYYGNDIENESSASKCADPIVVVSNPYYE